MNNLKTFYYIVPTNDGCVYLALNSDDMIVKARKEAPLNTSLLFDDALQAQTFIDKHIEESSEFKVEEVYLNKDYYKELNSNA